MHAHIQGWVEMHILHIPFHTHTNIYTYTHTHVHTYTHTHICIHNTHRPSTPLQNLMMTTLSKCRVLFTKMTNTCEPDSTTGITDQLQICRCWWNFHLWYVIFIFKQAVSDFLQVCVIFLKSTLLLFLKTNSPFSAVSTGSALTLTSPWELWVGVVASLEDSAVSVEDWLFSLRERNPDHHTTITKQNQPC